MAKAINKGKPAPKLAPQPVLVFTKNGRVIGKVTAPKGANDIRIIFGFGILGGFGWWTRNGKIIPKSGFIVPPGTNDWHFSLTGKPGRGIPLIPPPGANDIEIIWEFDRITEAWWTRDGKRFERIMLQPDIRQLSWAVKDTTE